MLYPLLEKYDNIYFDISSNQANDILDICKKHFGSERALFGTNYPYKSVVALKELIEYSNLNEEDKDKVAYKELGAEYLQELKKGKQIKRHIQLLKELGVDIEIKKVA